MLVAGLCPLSTHCPIYPTTSYCWKQSPLPKGFVSGLAHEAYWKCWEVNTPGNIPQPTLDKSSLKVLWLPSSQTGKLSTPSPRGSKQDWAQVCNCGNEWALYWLPSLPCVTSPLPNQWASTSWDHIPNKLPAPKSLSQGRLLEEAGLRHI